MKFRKLLLVAVITLLTVTLMAGTALAGQGWDKGKGKGPKDKGVKIRHVQVQKFEIKAKQKVSKHHFSDVSDKHWGVNRIRAMVLQGVINGYGNGCFKPNASVSNIEALAMILRLENPDKDTLKEALKDQDVPRSVPAWGKAYAALAVEEGILTEKELKKFRPMAAAKRYEVAIYLGRALDIDPDDAEDDHLDFRDVKSIPEEALDYLPYFCERGYFTGYNNGKFMPNKPVTRAEMAAILSKVAADEADEDDDIEISDQFKAKGKISELDDDKLVLKTKSGAKKEFSVDDDDVIVFLNNKEADYDDLKKGFTALVLCNSDREALLIYASSNKDYDEDEDEDEDDEADIDEVEGILLEIDDGEIIIKVGSSRKGYPLEDDVDVEIDGDDAALDELLPGMTVELTLENNEVVEINAESLKKINGVLRKINDDEIVVRVSSQDYTYSLDDDVEVEIDGDDADLDELLQGMDVELVFDDGKVADIEAKGLERIRGEFRKANNEKVVIRVDGEDYTYSLDDDVEVELDGDEADLDDLEKGMDVKLKFDDGEVVEIAAES